MHRAFPTACLLFAWLCANGAVWDVVQACAWARMFTGYAQTLSVCDALRETFDPAKPCDLCRTVQKAQDAQREQAPVDAAFGTVEKILLTSDVPAPLVLTPPIREWPAAVAWKICARTERVPVPPPRA